MVESATRGKQFVCSLCQLLCYRLISWSSVIQQGLLADKERDQRVDVRRVIIFSLLCFGFIEGLDAKGILPTLTSETISDSAECYAGLSVLFESSAACM